MPASSQASSELSTASLTAVRRAFLGLSKPSRCLFFAKNSLTEMSRCFAAIDSAVTARRLGCAPVSLTFAIIPFFHFAGLPDGCSTRRNGERGGNAEKTRRHTVPTGGGVGRKLA